MVHHKHKKRYSKRKTRKVSKKKRRKVDSKRIKKHSKKRLKGGAKPEPETELERLTMEAFAHLSGEGQSLIYEDLGLEKYEDLYHPTPQDKNPRRGKDWPGAEQRTGSTYYHHPRTGTVLAASGLRRDEMESSPSDRSSLRLPLPGISGSVSLSKSGKVLRSSENPFESRDTPKHLKFRMEVMANGEEIVRLREILKEYMRNKEDGSTPQLEANIKRTEDLLSDKIKDRSHLLYMAVNERNPDYYIVKKLADKDMVDLNYIDTDDTKYTPLMVASYFDHSYIVEILIKAGADPNFTNPAGWSALMIAAWPGNADCVRVLLEHGAEPNKKNNQGMTALKLAKRCGRGTNRLRDQAGKKLPLGKICVDLLKKAGASD